MWQDVVAFAIVALTFGLVVTRRVKQMRSGSAGAPHCAKCPGWQESGSGSGGEPAAARRGRSLIPASSLKSGGRGPDSAVRDGSRRAG